MGAWDSSGICYRVAARASAGKALDNNGGGGVTGQGGGDGPHYKDEEEHNENGNDNNYYDNNAMAVVSVSGGFRDELIPPASCEVEGGSTVRIAGR